MRINTTPSTNIPLQPMQPLSRRLDFGLKPEIEGLSQQSMYLKDTGFKELVAPYNLSPLNTIDMYNMFSQKNNRSIMDFKLEGLHNNNLYNKKNNMYPLRFIYIFRVYF